MDVNRRDFLKISLATTGLLFLAPPGNARAAESSSAKSKAVLVDSTKCVGCWLCYDACQKAHELSGPAPDPENPPGLSAEVWSTLYSGETDQGKILAKRQCMHCLHPACAEACVVGALQKTPEGPVVYDDRKCIGCRYCMVACPFGIPTFEWDESVPWIRKCNFCAERQAEGQPPACVAACPMGTLKYGDREELLAEARQRIAAEPEKYFNHIYGEHEAGGTSWLYIASVPMEQMGFPYLGNEPVTVNAARAMGLVPPVLLGVAAAMTGIYWLTKRKVKLAPVNEDKDTAGRQK